MHQGKLKVAVIEGFHPFEVPHWKALFESMADIDYYLQSIDNWAVNCGDARSLYDVLLFYNMNMANNSPFKDALDTVLRELGDSRQGLVLLHHALLAYPQNQDWSDMVGIADRSFGYHLDQEYTLEIANAHHPISQGLEPTVITDETYTMAEPDEDSTVLFTANHDKSMQRVGWVREYKNARVFCFQCGHDHLAWENPLFRRILSRGIQWAGKRI